ncbi:hypothetical protein COU59_00520 [Candidatus Pacearchaeota archaeon CG10_big_fil_rev_8_21_14_0_10_34_12]|nr:MAG: hypothetical protein COU59_00520 [Candidatus Pacearchaeota archaeon CG10_big_fil_rev_8_21_14_0_10_34_12]
MNLGFYLEKLHASEEFRKFIAEHSPAHFCSGFFVLDKEASQNKVHLDFLILETNEVFSFKMEEGIQMAKMDGIENRTFEEIPEDLEINFGEIENLIEEEMKKQGIGSKIQKIIVSLQKNNEKVILAGTVFLPMLGMIKISISLPEMEIREFEKKSFFDILQVRKKEE